MQIIKLILVTNYNKGIFNKPLHELNKGYNLDFNESTNELTINDSLFCHVFNKLPRMRNIESNKSWFSSNIYHF